jgi:mannose-6-phosphate isomerase-like protein (cupin superfamily)
MEAKAEEAGERVVHTRRADVEAFVTKDGSVVRELMHPNVHGNSNTSVAECIVAAGQTTLLHKVVLERDSYTLSCRHHKSEEIYHITAGSGLMELGGRQFMVQAGDTVCIDPGTEHRITNNTSGSTELKIIAVSSPPYQHSDSEVV